MFWEQELKKSTEISCLFFLLKLCGQFNVFIQHIAVQITEGIRKY